MHIGDFGLMQLLAPHKYYIFFQWTDTSLLHKQKKKSSILLQIICFIVLFHFF